MLAGGSLYHRRHHWGKDHQTSGRASSGGNNFSRLRVSWNGGTPKWSKMDGLKRKSHSIGWFEGTPISGNHQISWEEKKQLVFDASIDGSSTSLGKLTEQDCGCLLLSFCNQMIWDDLYLTRTMPPWISSKEAPLVSQMWRRSSQLVAILTRLALEVTHPSSSFEGYI